MDNKELAVELVKARLEFNSKLQRSNGESYGKLLNANHIAQEVSYYEGVLEGNIDPFKKKEESK